MSAEAARASCSPGDPAGAARLPAPAEAVASLVARLSPVGTEQVRVSEAAGRVLAEAVRTDRPNPPCDVSAMDGYALRLADAVQRRLPVSAEVAIGQRPPNLALGTTVRIFTGGAVPPEAEAVIRREDVREQGDTIELSADLRIERGMNIRFRGENASDAAVVLEAGAMISAGAVGVLATFGVAEVTVHRRVRTAILATGNELLPVEAVPEPWQIRDSNGPALSALLGDVPWLNCQASRRVPDRPEALRDALVGALETCDAVVLTGGVSMGDYDFVPETVQAVGGEVVFHKIAQRPGKPMLGAVGPKGQAILGLPGNPVPAMVTLRRWGSVILRRLAGHADPDPLTGAVTITHPDDTRREIAWHRLVRLIAPGQAELVRGKGSGDLVSLAQSNGFVELPPGASGPGPWPFHPWRLS